MPSKKELRTLVRQLKAAHTPDELRKWSEDACRGVCRLAVWQRAQSILLYSPLPDEVDVAPLIRRGWAEGKQVYLPVVTGPAEIEIRLCTPRTPMQAGAFGIMEPAGRDASPEECAGIDLAVVPGMAFDRQGHRLGRGKGYYDRLLTRLGNASRLGVCFPFQVLQEIPSEAHDKDMQDIVCHDRP